MNGAQMAHWLKALGRGSEWAGIHAVYRSGWLVGAGQTAVVLIGGYAVCRIGKWGYERFAEYLLEHGYIDATGEVV